MQSLAEFDGIRAIVHELQIPEFEAIRLRSLGVFVGQSIAIQRAAAAVIICAAGGRLAVSNDIARQIIVCAQDGENPLAKSA